MEVGESEKEKDMKENAAGTLSKAFQKENIFIA